MLRFRERLASLIKSYKQRQSQEADYGCSVDISILEAVADTGQVDSIGFWDDASKRLIGVIRDRPTDFLRSNIFMQCLHPPLEDQEKTYFRMILDQDRQTREKLLYACIEDPCGTPLNSSVYPLSSPLSLQHASHLIRMKSNGIDPVEYDFIVDIGGGYGAFARTVFNTGFNGEYLICDMPSMLQIQESYLNKIKGGRYSGKVLFRTVDRMDEMLRDYEGKKGLMIATWSLSEMPLDLRERLEKVMMQFSSVYIVFQADMEGLRNMDYFISLASRNSGFEWVMRELTEFRNNYYLLGKQHHLSPDEF